MGARGLRFGEATVMAKRTDSLPLHEAIRQVGQAARIAIVLVNRLHPSMEGLAALENVDRKLAKVDELLADARER